LPSCEGQEFKSCEFYKSEIDFGQRSSNEGRNSVRIVPHVAVYPDIEKT
jgi:hypothetical protein